jgi:hypothetical protein
MLQLHRSNQSPFNRQFGMASGCSLMGAFVANLSGFSLAFGQVVWQGSDKEECARNSLSTGKAYFLLD